MWHVSSRSGVATLRTAYPHALDSAAAAGFGGAMPHASPLYIAADDFTVETYHYGRPSCYSEDAALDIRVAHTFFDLL